MGLLDLLSGLSDLGMGIGTIDVGDVIPETAVDPIADMIQRGGYSLSGGDTTGLDLVSLSPKSAAMPFTLGGTDFSGNPLPVQYFGQDETGAFVPLGTNPSNVAHFPGFNPSLSFDGGTSSASFADALNRLRDAASRGLSSAPSAPSVSISPGRSGGGAMLNLPSSEIPSVPRVDVPSVTTPAAGAGGLPEPLAFKPIALDLPQPQPSPIAGGLDRLSGLTGPTAERFPESSALALRRTYRV